MARRRAQEDDNQELNLAPIMNIVMILIPLLLLSTVFMKAGVINISSPRNAQSTNQETEEQEEETPVPRVVVFISDDGFRVGDQRNLPEFQQFTAPIARCGGGGGGANAEAAGNIQPHDMANIPPTVCNVSGADPGAPLIERLDFGSLYNQLVKIRLKPEWFDRFGEENNAVISILGDAEVPFEVVVATMDTARFFVKSDGAALEAPTAASAADAYLIGANPGEPTADEIGNAKYIQGDDGLPVELFPDPVLLLPRPSAGG